MSKNIKKTSKGVASKAARTLTAPNASKTAKKLAGLALSTKGASNQTGVNMEDFASKVLQSDKCSKDTKWLAGSVLSQSNNKR